MTPLGQERIDELQYLRLNQATLKLHVLHRDHIGKHSRAVDMFAHVTHAEKAMLSDGTRTIRRFYQDSTVAD